MSRNLDEFVADFAEIDECPVCGDSAISDYLRMPYCGSDVEEYLIRYYRLGGEESRARYAQIFCDQDYVLSSCSRCGSSFQRNRPGPNILRLVYDHWISSNASGLAAAASLKLHDVQHYMSEAIKLTEFAMQSTGVSELPRLRVLDHGMGNGFFALSLKACLAEVWGTEFAQNRLRFAGENGIRALDISEELPESYFHFINTEQVMEHVSSVRETIAKLVRALAPGGILKVSVPQSTSIENGDKRIDWLAGKYARNSPMPLAPLEHLQYYPRSSRKVIAFDHGLDILQLPRWYHIRFGNNWSARGIERNLGRLVLMNRMRNYFIFRKPKEF
jgi:SAM-dependent methyltransferase